MNRRPADLAQIQRWMQSVITHPGGVEAALESDAARRHLEVAPGELQSVIRPSQMLDSQERLEIYVDAYYERLLECLREEYPATGASLGEELFDALAFGYLQSYPSRSYTLHALGASFPRYLEETRLHERERPSDAPESWGTFVIELATFERLLREVYDGPGSERGGLLTAADLAALPPERLGDVRLRAAPCLRLQRFSHPVAAYWSAHKAGEPCEAPAAAEIFLAISRRNYSLAHCELSALEYQLLTHLVAAEPLGAALSAVAQAAAEGELETLLQTAFAAWTARGFFAGVELAGA